MIAVPSSRHASCPCQLNLTALLDVVLQLIVFFILVSQLGLEDQPDLRLPNLQNPQVQRSGQSEHVFVNVLSAVSEAGDRPAGTDSADTASIRLEDRSYSLQQLPAFTEHLASLLEKHPGLQVLVRGDATLRYSAVRPVLDAIGTAGAKDVGLVALAQELTANR